MGNPADFSLLLLDRRGFFLPVFEPAQGIIKVPLLSPRLLSKYLG
nr:MAG TPA: hypothetical protein [Caudoviricetes sp.]